jgi:hypothetical protein
MVLQLGGRFIRTYCFQTKWMFQVTHFLMGTR